MKPSIISKLHHVSQPILELLPLHWQVKLMSAGRQRFMKEFCLAMPEHNFIPDKKHAVTAWGLKFRTPLMNSAGMFKNGDGYDVVAALGAGGYIGGTSTANPRIGNVRNAIHLPFVTLPSSSIAINWLGLPNLGDELLANMLITKRKLAGCPIGWSVMRSPDYTEEDGMQLLINSLWKYHNNPQIDFIEINESCPNIRAGGGNIINRLTMISEKFLKQRKRPLPIIVKLSNDITYASLDEILVAMIKLGFDGINLGNTSIDYLKVKQALGKKDLPLFEYFTRNYGGGVSGVVLQKTSLNLCAHAANKVAQLIPDYEFHIIRSGGVQHVDSIQQSLQNGATLMQWYTGFFTNYNRYGENIYRELF